MSRNDLKDTFDDEWKHWIWSNVHEGVPKEALFKALLGEGWDHDSIKRELSFDLNERATFPTPMPTSNAKPRSSTDCKQEEAVGSGKSPALWVSRGDKFDSDKLELYIIDNFLSGDECKALIKLSKGLYVPSGLTSYNKDKEYRTSTTCHFNDIKNSNDKNFAYGIEQRITDHLGLGAEHCEGTQLQRYEVGQQFKEHHDPFGEPDYDQETEKHTHPNGDPKWGQRTFSFMIYLNDVKEGGTTFFKKLRTGFAPQAGRAVVWNSINEDGSLNEYSLHAGTPVDKGEKYITTTWFRNTWDEQRLIPKKY